MADDDWSSLADDLLGYQQQQAHRAIGLDELAADLFADLAPGPEQRQDHADEQRAEQPGARSGSRSTTGFDINLRATRSCEIPWQQLSKATDEQSVHRIFQDESPTAT